MRNVAPSARIHVWVCGLILAVAFATKVFGLVNGGGLLKQSHPFLPGTYEWWIWLSLAAEVVAFAALALAGARVFLAVSLGLAVPFIAYHALEVGLQVSAPCPCLGGVLGHWQPLARAESALSFVLACGLGVSSFAGLFPPAVTAPPNPPPQSAKLSSVVATGLWLVAGAVVVGLWRGRMLGGDEGMEAAKSLQLLFRPDLVERMWNDQPPLWSVLGAGLFRVCGPSMTAGRVAVVLCGMGLALTLGIYWARAGAKWAAVIAVLLLWLSIPVHLASFMLEAPAYSIGIAALLPLLLLKDARFAWLASAAIAALALSIKLTAAFALVVPFTWLVQRGWRRGIAWGLAAVALTLLSSLLQRGWSWAAMAGSHLNPASGEIGSHHLDPVIYATGWLVCLLAVFTIANRYVKNQFTPLTPWVAAASAALLIHLIHRPFWDYYNLHLLAPVAVLAGVGAVDFWRMIRRTTLFRWERRALASVGVMLGLLWVGQRGREIQAAKEWATVVAASPITQQLKTLGNAGHTMFSMNPAWTFAAGHVQTPPELTIIPLKREWSGQINDTIIAQLLQSNRVDALVLNQAVLQEPTWTNLLAGYSAAARDGRNILFVRRELHPRSIDLKAASETTVDLRQLGLR